MPPSYRTVSYNKKILCLVDQILSGVGEKRLFLSLREVESSEHICQVIEELERTNHFEGRFLLTLSAIVQEFMSTDSCCEMSELWVMLGR